ncbi:MAG: hypothetical protein GY732_12085 [Gammaproteobacteria bacterium]|nr:hypothetical protein [Gammaproteobacteria bacterium]
MREGETGKPVEKPAWAAGKPVEKPAWAAGYAREGSLGCVQRDCFSFARIMSVRRMVTCYPRFVFQLQTDRG